MSNYVLSSLSYLFDTYQNNIIGDTLDDFMSENGLSVVYSNDSKGRKCPNLFDGRKGRGILKDKDSGEQQYEDSDGSDGESSSILQVLKRLLVQGLINILFEMTRGFGWGLGHGSGIRLLDSIYGSNR